MNFTDSRKGMESMHEIRQIFCKEIARIFQDKKIMLSVFVLPVVVMVGVMSLTSTMAKRAIEDVASHEAVIYLQRAPEGFETFLKTYGPECELRTLEDADRQEAEEQIRSGEADLWIEFPENFQRAVEEYTKGDEIVQVKTYYNPSEDYSSQAYDTFVAGILESYRQTLLEQRIGSLEELVVFTVNSDNPDMIIQDESLASARTLGMMLPYFVTILLFAGAMGIGTDMVAGEKERGTMASLLVAPIKRSSIVLGKVFALMAISGISSIIYVAALVVFMPQMLGGISGTDVGFNVSLSPPQILMLAMLLLAIAFLYSAIIVLISVFAKTVKEASTYIMPAYMLILILGITTMFTTGETKDWLFAVPIYNISLALQSILTQQVTIPQYFLTLGMTLALGVVMVAMISKAFESEKVMAL